MNRGSLIVVALAVALAGCSGAAEKLLEPITGKKDEILPGTRESVLQNTSPLDKGKTKEAATDPSPPGSETSSRRPPTSTTTVCRSSGSAPSAGSPP